MTATRTGLPTFSWRSELRSPLPHAALSTVAIEPTQRLRPSRQSPYRARRSLARRLVLAPAADNVATGGLKRTCCSELREALRRPPYRPSTRPTRGLHRIARKRHHRRMELVGTAELFGLVSCEKRTIERFMLSETRYRPARPPKHQDAWRGARFVASGEGSVCSARALELAADRPRDKRTMFPGRRCNNVALFRCTRRLDRLNAPSERHRRTARAFRGRAARPRLEAGRDQTPVRGA